VEGDFVLRTGGYAVLATSSAGLLLGVAMEDAHNDLAGANYILVLVATSQVLFKMSVYDATPANNCIEAADLGDTVDINPVTAGYWRADKSTATNLRGRIQQFLDPLGEEAGQVLVQIVPAYREV